MENKDFVFGIQSVSETLKSNREIDRLLIQKELEKSPKLLELIKIARESNIPVTKVPFAKLDRITRKNHQGVIAFISAVFYVSLHNVVQGLFEQGKNPLILILDRITDVRNFGAICRSAECAGVHAIVIPQKGAAQINSDAMKTSSGALNFIPVCRENNLTETLLFLQNSGLQIVACTEKAKKTIYEVDYTIPTALILGSEEDGISTDLLKKAAELAKIPMSGKIASLNVSVAAGIIVYEALRQRGMPPKSPEGGLLEFEN